MKIEHGTFISKWEVDIPGLFSVTVGKDLDRLDEEEFNKLISEGLIKYVGKESNYSIYIYIEPKRDIDKTVLDEKLIEEMALFNYYYVPGDWDDYIGLNFNTTWGSSIRFLTKLCDQGLDVSVVFDTPDKNGLMLNSNFVNTINKVAIDLNNKLVQADNIEEV